MNPVPSRRADREAALAQLEARRCAAPADLAVQLDCARLLVELGRDDEAKERYLEAVARAPNHPRVLNDLGTLLLRTGYRNAARTVFERAVAVEPDSARARVNLATADYELGDYEAARAGYLAALGRDPALVEAHQGLSYALLRLDRAAEADVHRRLGFAERAVTASAFRGAGEPVDVLQLVAAGGGTLYTDEFLDDRTFRTTTVVAEFFAGTPLPPHRVIFNAISDADRAPIELERMRALTDAAAVPVCNPPGAVLATARARNARRLAVLPDLVVPRIETFSRELLTGQPQVLSSAGFAFPLLLRAPGFHTGAHFVRVERLADVASAIAPFPGDEVLAIDYVALHGDDGKVRKYRVMFVDGTLYPLHAAVAPQWKVHYFSAEMATEPTHRAEDARFLETPAAVLGAAAMSALQRVHDLVGLDYIGIDFSLDRAGRVVVFEANATMIVLPPGPEAIWEYRRPHVHRIIAATRRMVLERAGRAVAGA